ncbi:MAG: DUF1634 domain-containing protein [Chloroflexota bacterium]
MSHQPPVAPAPPASLGRRIAAVLRGGTLFSLAAVSIGFAVGLVAPGPGPGARPVLELLASGGADALTAFGLLGLTLVPVAVAIVAGVTFAETGERRHMLFSICVLALLVASVVVATLLSLAG